MTIKNRFFHKKASMEQNFYFLRTINYTSNNLKKTWDLHSSQLQLPGKLSSFVREQSSIMMKNICKCSRSNFLHYHLAPTQFLSSVLFHHNSQVSPISLVRRNSQLQWIFGLSIELGLATGETISLEINILNE